jgi:hypothetical protein
MNASLCPTHIRAVTNYFGEPIAFQFRLDATKCVVCRGEMRIEEARRFAAHAHYVVGTDHKPEQSNSYPD